MTCYPCSTGRPEDCAHLALCPTGCCFTDDDQEDDQ